MPDLVQFVAIPDTDVRELPTQTLEVYEPDKAYPIASLTFRPEQPTNGSAGARLIAYDAARTVKLVTDVRARMIQLNLTAQDVRPITPAGVLPSLRFSRAVVPPNRLVLTVSKGDRRYREETVIDGRLLSEAPSDELVQFIEDLAVIQNTLNTTFPLPDTFTGRDAYEARRLRRLLDGERVAWLRGPVTVSLIPDRVAEFRAQFAERPHGWLRVSYDDIEIDFGDHTVHTGAVWLLGEMSVDLDTIGGGPDTPTAVFDVLGGGWMYAHRGVPDDQTTGGPERPVGSGRVAIKAGGPGVEA